MIIRKKIITGLTEIVGSRTFSIYGCENCNNKLGTEVATYKAYIKDDSVFPVNLCHECVCAYHNGDELPENCQNVFKI